MSVTTDEGKAMDLTTMTPAEVDTELFKALAPAQNTEAAIRETRKKLDSRYIREGTPNHDHYTQRLAALKERLNDQFQVAEPYEEEFDRRGGWIRYLVVSGGHLHYRACHTLHPGRTLVGLVPEASGLTADEVVGRYGKTACTHCFPDAPVDAATRPEDEGFCEHSGDYVPAEKLRPNWTMYAVAPSVRCECGHFGAITKSGKFRKHTTGRKD